MWREEPLSRWWQREQSRVTAGDRRLRKKALLRRLDDHLAQLRRAERPYPPDGLAPPPRAPLRIETREDPATPVFGRCPAYSERTDCCGLYTLDAAAGCPFSCSYCTIQTFYDDRAELRVDLADRLREIAIDPQRFYHIGTGQASDSLVWGDRAGMLDALCDFAARHPNVLLELKTKSDQVEPLLARSIPPNVVCSWTLQSDVVIRNEEHGTAPLAARLRAARQLADAGIRVAFHFHPLVCYEGWRDDYPAIAAQLLRDFRPSEVAFVSMGTLTFIRPVVQRIRQRGGETRVLQLPMTPDPHGKLTYPDETKVTLYRTLYEALRPWHASMLIYLCMEKRAIWQAAFGWSYPDGASFQRDFVRRTHGWSE
jgi:spore photoproduct lyase